MRLLDHLGERREVLELDRRVLHLGTAANLIRVERAGAEDRELDTARPADVDIHGVGELRRLARLTVEVDEPPVEPGIEPRSETRGHIGGQHRLREQHSVEALVAHELREHVDARLRQRRRHALVVGDPHRPRAVRAGALRERAHTGADEHAADVAADLRRLRKYTERALRNRAFMMLEKDQRLGHQTSRFETRNSRICSAPEPSSSIFRASPRARRRVQRDHRRRGRLGASDIHGRKRLLRLLLRAHDPLQRRIPRRVDRVRDRDHRRQRRADRVVAVLGLPLARSAPPSTPSSLT